MHAAAEAVGGRLDRAENTVEFYVTKLLRKAAVQNRTQLVAKILAAE